MGIWKYIEYYLARLLYSQRGRDAKLLVNSPIFKGVPKNLEVVSPDVGVSGSHFPIEYTQYGANKFPQLSWSLSVDATISQADIKEYVMICEDPDAPLPLVPIHGIFFAIPPTKTHLGPEDIQLDREDGGSGAKWLKGGFRLGKNIRGTIYGGPRPPVGHGEHRYFFQVVALKDKLDPAKMSGVATKSELMEQMKSHIIGYGVWIGIFERKWE